MSLRILSLVFDDGFAKSFREIAEIHEEFDLSANLNIIARACTPEHQPADEWHRHPMGGWDLWNELRLRGHDIEPHSWSHANHAQISPGEARSEVDRCLDAFAANLNGFDPATAVYAFPYNASNDAIEAHALGQMRAVRSGGTGFNDLPTPATKRIHCTAFGPGNCEAHLDTCIAAWLERDHSWLAYNLHGLGDEGWGPVGADYLRRLYERLLKLPGVEILPPAVALQRYG